MIRMKFYYFGSDFPSQAVIWAADEAQAIKNIEKMFAEQIVWTKKKKLRFHAKFQPIM